MRFEFKMGTSIDEIIKQWKMWYKKIDFAKVKIIMCTVYDVIITEYVDE